MKKAILILFLLVLGLSATAQVSYGPSIAGTTDDINYLAEGYLSPFGDALAFSLTNGWYNTADIKRTGRFEIGFSPSVTIVSSDFQTFTIDNSQLQELELVDASLNTSPTVFGEEIGGAALQYKDPALRLLGGGSFNLPSGLGFNVSPMMTLQAGVGLPFDFELSGRFLPSTSIPLLEGSEIGTWGIGLKHDLSRYIPKGGLLPFDIAIFASYTQMDLGQDLEADANNDKRLDITANALVTRLLVSKKLLFLTFYGGIGYNQLSSNIKISGTYDYINPTNLTNPQQSLVDPIDFTSDGGSGLAANVGLRVKFLVFGYVSADYTYGTFSAVNLSFGFSWDL